MEIEPLQLSRETLANLEDNLMLFFTGFTRNASAILQDQDARSRQNDSGMLDNLHYVKQLATKARRPWRGAICGASRELMHVHWEHKKKRSQGMSNSRIDEFYELGAANGALGGKLIGAGGGGFLMFYTEDKTRLRHVMARPGCAKCASASISRHPGARAIVSAMTSCFRWRFWPAGWARASVR